jgi:hypothetical protein
MCIEWDPIALAVCDWAFAKLDSDAGRERMRPSLRLALAELAFHRGDRAKVERALEGIDNGIADALRAALLVKEGRFAEAQPAFEAALRRRQGEFAARKRVLSATIAWVYPLCLLAQQTPMHLTLARKFCIGEAGKRDHSP